MENERIQAESINASRNSGTGRVVVGHKWPNEHELVVILSDDFDEARTAALIRYIYDFV